MALFLSAFFKYRHMNYSGRDQLDTLFKQYEASFDKLDIKALSKYCADTFISAGPRGTIARSKEEFEEKGQHAVRFYKSVGRNSAKIVSRRMIPISDCYSLVVIRWGITFEKTGSRLFEFDVTYIVHQVDSNPKIILMISHDEEETAIKRFGAMP